MPSLRVCVSGLSPPVLTVTATVAMGLLFGFPGLLFATPMVVVLMTLVRMVYVEGVLGDREGGVGP